MPAGVNVATLNAVVTADTGDFDSKIDSANQKTDSFASGTDRAATSAANFGGASLAMQAGAIGIEAGLVNAVMAAGDFQSSINEIGAVSGASADQLSQLSDMALKVGQDTSFSPSRARRRSRTGQGRHRHPGHPQWRGDGDGEPRRSGGRGYADRRDADVQRHEHVSDQRRSGRFCGRYARRRRERLLGGRVAPRAGSCAGRPVGIRTRTLLQETVAQLALFSNYGMQGSDAGTSMKTMLTSLIPDTKAKEEFTNPRLVDGRHRQ
jgi:hypothetical protein